MGMQQLLEQIVPNAPGGRRPEATRCGIGSGRLIGPATPWQEKAEDWQTIAHVGANGSLHPLAIHAGNRQGSRQREQQTKGSTMKAILLAACAAIALAAPASAQNVDWAAQQQMLAQQQFQEQMLQQQMLQQQQQAARQQMQFNWGARCAARMYQNCY
jgi:hypothetical protein